MKKRVPSGVFVDPNGDKKLLAAYERNRKATQEYHAAIVHAFPRGRCITYNRKGRLVWVNVLDCSFDRVRVVNPETQNEYWIHTYAIIEAMRR